MKRCKIMLTVIAAVVLFTGTARAHFAWLMFDNDGRVCYFFGESPADRTYHMPTALSETKVQQATADQSDTVALDLVDEDDYVGLRSAKPAPRSGRLRAKSVYGLYQGVMLVYHTQNNAGLDPADWPQAAAEDVQLQAVLTKDADGLQAKVLWEGKPLAGVDVTLYCEDGHNEGTATTNSEGIAKFDAATVEPGLNGLLVNYTDKNASGEWQGKPYKSATHILTATFDNAAADDATKGDAEK
ncbi:MAG: hypothetical protein R3C10_00665 [Pirellulales bacterium]